jgi:molybdopterin converting factor small subunit
MKISLKLIATYRQLLPEGTPGNTVELEIAPGTTVEEVLSKFGVPLDETSVFVVNGRMPVEGQQLKEGDVVSAFPALAGG